jgi:pimeloyl-ACP methyl ester carboxylesterase
MLETTRGTLFYVQRGTGQPVLVCVHGAGGTHQHWGCQFAGLRDTARVIALDLPGHGRSPGPGCTSIADYSAVLLAALDALALQQVIVAGHSMGGGIALSTALEAPQRVAGLVLAGTGARLPVSSALYNLLTLDFSAAIRLMVDGIYDQSTTPKRKDRAIAAFMQIEPGVFRGDLLACDAFDVRSRLAEISCPALVICGNADHMTPPGFSRALQEGIAAAELVMLPHAGHMLTLEQPEAVTGAMQSWITSRYKSG